MPVYVCVFVVIKMFHNAMFCLFFVFYEHKNANDFSPEADLIENVAECDIRTLLLDTSSEKTIGTRLFGAVFIAAGHFNLTRVRIYFNPL